MKRIVLSLAIVALVVALFLSRGPAPVRPTPAGAFSFAAFGDAPYYWWEELRFRIALESMNRYQPRFAVHVGDVFWRPCSDAMYAKFHAILSEQKHPVIYTPGDNEWTDCWTRQEGRFVPLERLAKLRSIFYAEPHRSLGARPLALVTQADQPRWSEFVEHARWTDHEVVFATLHLPGSRNATEQFDGRSAADDAEVARRTAAVDAWTSSTFEEARRMNAPAIVLFFHAATGLEFDPSHGDRVPYNSFLDTLERETKHFGRPVLLVHGDDHRFKVDHPLVDRSTDRPLANLTRLEVPGSPDVGWVRVLVHPGPVTRFSFESHVIPEWKWW